MFMDEQQHPIITFNMDESASMQDMINHMQGLMQRNGPRLVLLVDCTRGLGNVNLDASGRKLVTDFVRANRDLMKRTLAGIVTVHNSTFIRGVITATRWVSPMPVPDAIFARKEEAIAWSHARLREPA